MRSQKLRTSVDLIKKGFSQAIDMAKRNYMIYRGKEDSHLKLSIVNPAKHRRPSKNTSDLYNTLIDIVPSWKDWPKRSRSIVCSSTYINATNYGDIHLVLPKNEAKLGICSRRDFWSGFPVIEKRLSIDSMDDFNWMLARFLKPALEQDYSYYDPATCKKALEDLQTISPQQLQKALQRFEEDNEDNPESRHFSKDIRKNFHGDWLEYFSELLDPTANKFILTDISHYDKIHGEREVWTDSVCLLYTPPYSSFEEWVDEVDEFLKKL